MSLILRLGKRIILRKPTDLFFSEMPAKALVNSTKIKADHKKKQTSRKKKQIFLPGTAVFCHQ